MTTTYWVIEAKLADKSAVWIATNDLKFRRQDRTLDETLGAAANKGMETIYNADLFVSMRAPQRQRDHMHKIIDEAWRLAQVEFGFKDEQYSRRIEISVAAARDYT